MKHPGGEEWMAWLYGEVPRAEKTRLAAHLKDCSECRADVRRWEKARQALDFGKVTPPRARARVLEPLVKWGIAAGLMLGIGFGVGRLTSPATADSQTLRASLKAQLHDELLAELQQHQAQDNKVIFTALGKVDADRVADYASLRKELETVAVLTQDSFQQAQQQIVTLANYSQTDGKTLNQ
jgi:anti-sigma factor RsiW